MVMQEQLVIYLHAAANEVSWAVVTADGQVRQSAYRDAADGLAAIAEEKQIVVLVPAQDVSLLKVKLPKLSEARLMAAIPFALEEKLVADVDTLHFVPSSNRRDDELAVAIVTHEKMQAWLQQLQNWHIEANVMLPASLALPMTEHSFTIFLDDIAIVRSDYDEGFACERTNLAETMAIALATTLPELKRIQLYNATGQSALEDLANVNQSIVVNEYMITQNRFIAALAEQTLTTPILNLLSGPYVNKKTNFSATKIWWQYAAYLGAGWIALLFLSPIISFFMLNHRLNNLNEAIGQIYKVHFPNASTLVAPKLRMDEKLQKLTGQIGENRVLVLLGYVGKSLKLSPNVDIKRMDFRNNQLTLDVSAASSDAITSFSDYLTAAGITVKQQNANFVGTRMNATMTLR